MLQCSRLIYKLSRVEKIFLKKKSPKKKNVSFKDGILEHLEHPFVIIPLPIINMTTLQLN